MIVDFQLVKLDLNQYGERFEIQLFLPVNGSLVKMGSFQIQEHDFESLKKHFINPPELSGQFKHDERYI